MRDFRSCYTTKRRVAALCHLNSYSRISTLGGYLYTYLLTIVLRNFLDAYIDRKSYLRAPLVMIEPCVDNAGSTGRDCPARVAPMSRREARRPEGPGSRARRAERQSSTARRALRWSRPVFLLTLTVVAGGCATMGCALSEHHTLHSAPHLRREFHEIRPVAKGSGLEKSTGSCGAPLLHWVCFK